MPARITVRAELAGLLAKSQETTDANRQAQLRREADQREDRKRLDAKAAKEEAASRKPLPDPVGRNIFTAAMGYIPPLQLGQFWFRGPRSGDWNVDVWSGDGLQRATASVDAAEVPADYGWVGNDVDILGTVAFQARFGVTATPGYTVASRGVTGNGLTFHFPLDATTAVVVYSWDYAIWWKAGATGLGPGVTELEEGYADTFTSVGNIPLGRRFAFGDASFIRGSVAFIVSKTAARRITVPASWAGRPAPLIPGEQGLLTMAVGAPLGIFPPDILTPHPGFVSSIDGEDLRFFTYSLGADANYLAVGDAIDGANVPHPQGGVWTPFASASFNQRAEISALPEGLTFAQQRARVPWAGVRETCFFLSTDDSAKTVSATALQLRDAAFDAAWPLGFNLIPLDDPRWIKRKVIGTDFSSQPHPSSPQAVEKLFWDWGKPAYCRAQLLEMGFAEADLEPVPPP